MTKVHIVREATIFDLENTINDFGLMHKIVNVSITATTHRTFIAVILYEEEA